MVDNDVACSAVSNMDAGLSCSMTDEEIVVVYILTASYTGIMEF